MAFNNHLSLVFCLALVAAAGAHSDRAVDKGFDFQYDSSAKTVKAFRQFSEEFFAAVRRKDTGFLSAHVVFPISNSFFYIFDESLMHKKIYARTFFNKLKKLFPEEDIKRIKKEGKYYGRNAGGKAYYVIELIFHEDEVDSNYSWLFMKKGGVFYFVNFRAEAG